MRTEREVVVLEHGRVALVLLVDREEPGGSGWEIEWSDVYGPRDAERLANDLAEWVRHGAFALDGRAGVSLGGAVVVSEYHWDDVERAIHGDVGTPPGPDVLREAVERARIFCRGD